MDRNDVKVFVPFELEKGTAKVRSGKTKTGFFIKGVASTPDWDSDGESLDPNGFDYSDFVKSGFFNWNHQANKDPLAIVGEPTYAEVLDNKFIVKGFLYGDNPLAQKIYKVGEILKKSGSSRRLGFSIEGKAKERDPLNKKRVLKANISHVAIAPSPKNKASVMDIGKSEVEADLIKASFGDETITISPNGDIEIKKSGHDLSEFFDAICTIVKGHEDGFISDDDFDFIKGIISELDISE